MSLPRWCRVGVLCALLLLPTIAAAPLADASPSHVKKCKKGYHRVKGKCKRKKKPVGAGTGGNSAIGGVPSLTSVPSNPLFDATGGIVVVGGNAASSTGWVNKITYVASRSGTIRFLLLDASAKVRYTTADIPVTGAPRIATYSMPARGAWPVNGGDRLGVWMSNPTAIGYTEVPRDQRIPPPPPGVLVGTSTTAPAVGTAVSVRSMLPARLYPFTATVDAQPACTPTSTGKCVG